MNTTILNREFKHPEDGFYHIEAKGFHPAIGDLDGEEVKLVQVIDDKAIASIVNRFNAAAKDGKLRHGHEMLIDHEHFRHEKDKESRAYGWAQEAQAREDGIYMRNRWTATGRPAVDGGDYRFFSTEYDGPVAEPVPESEVPAEIRNRFKGFKFMRPLQLTGLSLTNANNNRGQRPITNRQTTLDDSPGGEKSSSEQHIKNKMKNIAVELGLDANTDEQGILTVVRQLKNRGDISPADLTTLRNRESTLATENQTLLGEQVDALLDAHGVKEEKVRNRMKPVLIGLKNREDRCAALVDFGFKLVEAKPAEGRGNARVLNRESGAQPGAATEGNEQELAAKAEAEVNDYKIKNRCTYAQARNAVRTAKPELFGIVK